VRRIPEKYGRQVMFFFHVTVKNYFGIIYNTQLKRLSLIHDSYDLSISFWNFLKIHATGRTCVENTCKRDAERVGKRAQVIVTHENDLRDITIHYYLSL